MVFIGGATGFVGAFVIFLFFLYYLKNLRLEFLLISFLLTFFLADNISGFLSFANNLRFLILGISLIFLFKFKVLTKSKGMILLPFSLVAFLITLLLSPLGFDAIFRSFGFLFVALVLFKLVEILYNKDAINISNLLVVFLFIYFSINIVLIFLPGIPGKYIQGRFSGLMYNPNGLGLLSMLSFGVVDLLHKNQSTTFSDRAYLLFKLMLILLILMAGSRTALFSILIYICILRVYENKKVLVLVILLFIPSLYIFNNIDFIQIVEFFGWEERLRTDTLTSGSGRTETWDVAWIEIGNQPLFGKGMMYDNYFINDYTETYIGENAARHWSGIWSSYLSMLLNVGFVGLIVYLLFLFKCFKIAHNKKLAFAFLMLVLASGITESWMAASMNAFTPLLFLYFAIQAQTRFNYKES